MARKKKTLVSRKEVYKALDTERDYQDKLPPSRTDGRKHTVAEELLILRQYLSKADEAWVGKAGDAGALEVIRKIAGITVRCMENWGAPKRQTKP